MTDITSTHAYTQSTSKASKSTNGLAEGWWFALPWTPQTMTPDNLFPLCCFSSWIVQLSSKTTYQTGNTEHKRNSTPESIILIINVDISVEKKNLYVSLIRFRATVCIRCRDRRCRHKSVCSALSRIILELPMCSFTVIFFFFTISH